MLKVKRFSFLLSILLVITLILAACGSPSQNNGTTAAAAESTSSAATTTAEVKIDPMAKYEPSISLSTVIYLDSAREYPKDQTWDNNVWTQAYEEKMGVKLSYLWTVDHKQYEEKFNIAIAADDLPDVMKIPYKFFYKLAQNGKLADLTDVYDKYATDYVKEYFGQANDYAKTNCTVNGKLYGLAAPAQIDEQFQLLFIRDDWMKKLNLSAPKNAEDVVNIAKAFALQDPDGNKKADTVGLGMENTIYTGGQDVKGFFNMYHAYPRIWLEKDGKLVYGSIQPEMKTALGKLAELYNAGAIDKEFSIKGPWDAAYNDGVAGKTGMAFGVKWFQFFYPRDMAMNSKDMKMFWNSYLIPSADDKPALTTGTVGLAEVTCVSSKCKNPEAAVKLSNLATYFRAGTDILTIEQIESPEFKKYSEIPEDEKKIATFFFNYVGMEFHKLNEYLEDCVKIGKALEAKDPSILKSPTEYDACMNYLDGKAFDAYGSYYSYGPNQSYAKIMQTIEQKLYLLDKFSGPETETMVTNKPNIDSKEVEIFTQIIMGAKSLDEFDKWVQYFNEQGGAQITTEVNDWYTSVKGN